MSRKLQTLTWKTFHIYRISHRKQNAQRSHLESRRDEEAKDEKDQFVACFCLLLILFVNNCFALRFLPWQL